jgi:tRNA pseudouridine65 synthase
VHRLDRATSGVLVFALDVSTARAVGLAFQEGSIEKRYLALVRGAPPDRARVTHALSRENGEPQAAVTEILTLARYGRYALVEARPESGRTHQIRRHLKHLSCPIIGDVRYGKGEHNRFFRTQHGLHRLALHAMSLSLVDPSTGERITIEAPLPEVLARTLTALAEDGPADAMKPPGSVPVTRA